jgi:ribose/xylose/arabinose/galactoside ABC-type transport system permease subunit
MQGLKTIAEKTELKSASTALLFHWPRCCLKRKHKKGDDMGAVQVEQQATSSALPNQRTHPVAYLLAGGLIAGTLDILYAYTFWAVKSQISAQRIFQDVAAGLVGEASFQGGWSTAALGWLCISGRVPAACG